MRPATIGTAVALCTIALSGTSASWNTAGDPASFAVPPPPLGAKAICLAAAPTETKPFAVEPARAAERLWFLRPDLSPPSLMDGLGDHGYPVTTSSEEAQRFFDQGLNLAYGFNHAEAARAFRHAQKLDPACAMCFWGEAYVLGPNINAPMAPEAIAPAYAAAQRALALADKATPHEQALIAAMAKRYAPAAADRRPLDRAYADALAAAAARFPADAEIAVLYAEALMDLQPWDYWEKDGVAAKGRIADAVASVERVLRDNPRHPAAIHFYIHLVEASDRPERAERFADALRTLVPAAGHLVHMPSHIYYRIGRFADSLDANRKAVAADEAYIAGSSPQGLYPGAYYPHNIHFLMTSAQMGGDGATAVAAAEKLAGTLDDAIVRAVPWMQAVKQAPYFAHAQYSPPEVIMAVPDPGDGFPFVQAAWYYAQGIALSSSGDVAGALRQADAIAAIESRHKGPLAELEAGGLPTGAVLGIARLVVTARAARAQGDLATARDALAQAVALQDGIAYMEPPFWYYPVRQSLGAVLLESGDAKAAEAAFRGALVQSPNNSWVLYGLREALRQQGQAAGTAELDRRLGQVWIGPDRSLDLKRL
ncbi:tetratricopeptide (TPR) repeat protein [Constrictibacter sp. MBR-5]|jgi:tetratricopeptide (TPR) repeat protein|uniref:tetratricopeptide repeat protein n=1 Tax=Constrictibacter sp. MBR-5 TaxID=3156467 RepID=UPI0033978921